MCYYAFQTIMTEWTVAESGMYVETRPGKRDAWHGFLLLQASGSKEARVCVQYTPGQPVTARITDSNIDGWEDVEECHASPGHRNPESMTDLAYLRGYDPTKLDYDSWRKALYAHNTQFRGTRRAVESVLWGLECTSRGVTVPHWRKTHKYKADGNLA